MVELICPKVGKNADGIGGDGTCPRGYIYGQNTVKGKPPWDIGKFEYSEEEGEKKALIHRVECHTCEEWKS
jgi:hypothetical protein